MEQDASAFAAAVEEATDKVPTHAIQQLKGRFRFLWGVYKAHSEVRTGIESLSVCLWQPFFATCDCLTSPPSHGMCCPGRRMTSHVLMVHVACGHTSLVAQCCVQCFGIPPGGYGLSLRCPE